MERNVQFEEHLSLLARALNRFTLRPQYSWQSTMKGKLHTAAAPFSGFNVLMHVSVNEL